MGKQQSTIPVKEITPLLDKYGIDKTWVNLTYTYAVMSYPHIVNMLTKSKEYQHAEILDKNYLENLSLGEISIMYEYSLAYVNRDSRKQSGQYFTPDDIALWMATKSLGFPKGVWLDPCSGIGNLSYQLASIQEDPEYFITHNLILTDKDPLALLIARTLFTLHFYKNNSNLFEDLRKCVIVQDFLETPTKLPKQIEELKPDYAIVNPPYAVAKNVLFETREARDLYSFFLETIIKNMKGFISVTPQSYTNSTKFHVLRKLLINKFNKIDIYNFDNIPDSIFKGIKFGSTNTNKANSVRASIIIAQYVSSTKKVTRITPLLRWLRSERELMWKHVDNKLCEIEFTENIFPKNYKELKPLYETVQKKNWQPLSELVSKTPTKYALIVPTTPRYFITASKRELKRTSSTKLFFDNEEDMNYVYVVLNSSLLYWWWRVNDGGMTLSSKTLLSLPVPVKTRNYSELVSLLEDSEKTNLVTKMNAGKIQENVKHSKELVNKINTTLFGEKNAILLRKTHNNSNF